MEVKPSAPEITTWPLLDWNFGWAGWYGWNGRKKKNRTGLDTCWEVTITLPNKHYSGRFKTTEEEGNQRTRDKLICSKKCEQHVSGTAICDSTIQRWIQTKWQLAYCKSRNQWSGFPLSCLGLPANWTENTGHPSLPFPSPPLEVGPLNPARESGECCRLPSGFLGRAPAEIEFDAF